MATTAPSPPRPRQQARPRPRRKCAQHGDNFGGKLNGLQSRAGQKRSHPYGKAVLAARASSPLAVQSSRVVVIFKNEWLRTRALWLRF